MAFALAHELAPHGATAVSLTPGWLRSEAMLEAYGVTEANWRDATEVSPHFAISESPAFVGRAVAALAGDPDRARWNGQSLSSGQLAQVYGFTDLDGSRPDAWRYVARGPGRRPAGGRDRLPLTPAPARSPQGGGDGCGGGGGLGDAGRDADAAVAGAGDEQARREARRSTAASPLAGGAGRYCGNAPGQRETRTAVGCRSRPMWRPTSSTARSTSCVVVEVVDGQPVAAERDAQHLAVAAAPVGPLLRAERRRRDRGLHRLRARGSRCARAAARASRRRPA